MAAGSEVAGEQAATAGAGLVMSAESDTSLPDQIAYLPVVKPAQEFAVVASADGTGTDQKATEAAAAAQPANPAPAQPDTETVAAVPPQPEAPSAQPETVAKTAAAPVSGEPPIPADKNPADKTQVIVTATDPAAAGTAETKKRGFLSSLFGASPAAAAPVKPQKSTPVIELASAKPAAPEEPKEKPAPLLQLASATPAEKPAAIRASLGSSDALPGVRQTALFEIKRKSGIDDDSDVDLHEEDDIGPIRVASAAGLARLAPNGLLTQTDHVDIACLKPSLVRVLKTVEQHYGSKIVVTSGYRSPARNRNARGAKNSLHMYCAAADIQIEGVGKWELAKFARAMPGRGGVGTYCHTNSVHIDVGPERDWNWRCRRRK